MRRQCRMQIGWAYDIADNLRHLVMLPLFTALIHTSGIGPWIADGSLTAMTAELMQMNVLLIQTEATAVVAEMVKT